jgi:hypothetical protein
MKYAVVGSRLFNDYDLLRDELNTIDNITTIISGGAKGADTLAERYAREHRIELIVIRPDWSIGISAGILRNKQIVDQCDYLIAFWDGKSKGTKSSIDFAKKLGKDVKIVQVQKNI